MQTSANDKAILAVRDIAEMLDVTESHVYHMTSRGEIPYFKAGKRIRFSKTAIDKWIEEGGSKEEVV